MIKDFLVEAGHIMMFARAIGDDNPVYYDKEYAENTEVGGIIAPPTFIQAGVQYDDEWFLRPRNGEPWIGSGKTPSGAQLDERVTRGMHAEMHYEYHELLRSGDIINCKAYIGDTWSKVNRKGQTLNFEDQVTEYYNQNGKLVITAHFIVVIKE
ncbi:MAG TPA: MaoC family dehydratase N-terminal domain-containing protein [Syntrophomonas sp.]|nr:MaoC family dehydratase N-terminal domain-containing protein [Syntrophomonas sp.]